MYTGIALDAERRFLEHKEGKGGRYTRSHRAVKILYTESHASKGAALKREIQIKSWPRKKKLELVKLGDKEKIRNPKHEIRNKSKFSKSK